MKSSYLVKISSQVMENGVLAPHFVSWRGGFGDQSIPNAATVTLAGAMNIDPLVGLVMLTTGGKCGMIRTVSSAAWLAVEPARLLTTTE